MEKSLEIHIEILHGSVYTINKICIDFNALQKGVLIMELAKITIRGQITIPVEIRKKLGVRDGDKVIFLEENGRVVIENASMIALRNAQNAFAGEAERLGLETEQGVVDMVKEVRREMWEEANAGNV